MLGSILMTARDRACLVARVVTSCIALIGEGEREEGKGANIIFSFMIALHC